MKVRIAAEGKNSAAASRQLWSGLVRFNRITAGPLRYTRTVLTVRDAAGKIHGGLILHLNTYSFQAPGFYEKLGFRRFGGMEGSPAGASRHFFAKRLTR